MASRQVRRQMDRRARRLFAGRSAEQVHSDLAFPPMARCQACGSHRPMTRAIIMAPLDEAKKRMPELDAMMLLDPEGFMKQIVQIRENPTDQIGKPYFRISVVYACKSCTPSLERQLAKAPSWCIVELNRGPGPDRVQVATS